MIKLIICGAAGRMGRRIISCARAENDLRIVGAVEKPDHPDLGRDAGELAGAGRIGVSVSPSLDGIISEGDVVIDFSSPEACLHHAARAAERRKGLVIGTTGLSREDEDKIKKFAKSVACVYSPNMSVGVNVLFKLVKEVALILGKDYDIEVVETHHRFKKDAPSGTATQLARIIAAARQRDLREVGVYGRKGRVGERTEGEIGIHSVRAGDVVGEHTVIFSNLGERIELTHRAHSRDTFARGALCAARFVAGAPPGLYSMVDVLK